MYMVWGDGEINNHISPNYPFKPNSVKTVGKWKKLIRAVL